MKRDVTLAFLRLDGGTQSRAAIDAATVADYADVLDSLPPIVVFHDGEDYWLADGFHRVHAFKRAGRERIAADVRQGTQRDAVLYSVGANGTHGLRRTNEDKRRAIGTLLADEEWSRKGDRWIAKACGVSDKTVAAVRASTAEVPQLAPRLGLDGKLRRLPARKPASSEPEESAEPPAELPANAPAPPPPARAPSPESESDDDEDDLSPQAAMVEVNDAIHRAAAICGGTERVELLGLLNTWVRRIERAGRSVA